MAVIFSKIKHIIGDKLKITPIFVVYLALFFAGLAFSLAVAMWFPKYGKYFIVENGFVEDLQAVFYLLAALAAFFAAVVAVSKKYVSTTFSFLGLMLFMEEIAWGRKIFYKNHFYIKKVRIDSIHDFSELFVKMMDEYWASDKIFIIMEVVLFFAIVILVLAEKWKFFTEFLSKGKLLFFGMIFLCLAFSSILDARAIDFSNFSSADFVVLEEYFELGAAMAMMFLCANLTLEAWKGRREARASAKNPAS